MPKKTNNDWNTVYFRLKQSKVFDIECSTNIKVPNKRWSPSKSEVLPTKNFNHNKVNQDLIDLESFIMGEYNEDLKANVTFNSKWLKEKISKFQNRETKNENIDKLIFFTNYINSFIYIIIS